MIVVLASGRQIEIPTNDPKVAAAAARRFAANDVYEQTYANNKKNPAMGAASGALQTFSRAIPGMSELQAGIGTLGDAAGAAMSGQPVNFANGWKNNRDRQDANVSIFRQNHRTASDLATGGGLAAQIGAALLTGGGSDVPEAGGAVAKGISPMLARISLGTARNATMGAAAGALNGLSQPGSLRQRLKVGNDAILPGVAMGVALPPALAGAGKLTGGAVDMAQSMGNTAVRAANKASGGAILDPARTAAMRLAETLKGDGATVDQARTIMNEWLKSGASSPTLMDMASRLPQGGQKTIGLIRSAALPAGAGRGAAVNYADTVAADFQPNVIDRTRALTPFDSRSADEARAMATKARADNAATDYRAPYADVINAKAILPAIEGDAGRGAIGTAYKDADAMRLGQQMSELDKLREAANPDPIPQASIGGDPISSSPALADKIRAAMGSATPDSVPVSLGTLDRIKIALNDAGRDLADTHPTRSAGMFQRAQEIDDHLAAASKPYAGARDNYAKASAGIDALDLGARDVAGSPDAYLEGLRQNLAVGGPSALDNARIGMRDQLATAMGRPTEGATGYVNKVATGSNAGANLASSYGEQEAAAYRQALQNEVDRLKNARQIDPTQGSQTAIRGVDQGLASLPSMKPQNLVMGLINKIRSGATLTDEERAAIVRLGTMQARSAADFPITISDQGPPILPGYYPAASALGGAELQRRGQ